MGIVGKEQGLWKGGRDWRLSCALYADDLIMCGESEEDLKVMEGYLVEVCRRGLKVNAGNSKMGRKDWSVRFVRMGFNWSKCQSLAQGINP